MAKHRKRPDEDRTAALYVRIPVAEAEKLDRVAFELKTPKREVIRTLIADELDADKLDVLWHRPARPPAPPPPAPPLPDIPLPGAAHGDEAFTLGRAAFTPAAAPEVLTLAEAAELLQVAEAEVERLAAAGELPARRIGDEWRLLRRAVLDWLGSGDEPSR